jgi:hypothetical protein
MYNFKIHSQNFNNVKSNDNIQSTMKHLHSVSAMI